MQCVRHVDALPPVALNRSVDDVAHLRERAGFLKDGAEGCADPFGDVGPAFFADDLGDLVPPGECLKIGDRERQRLFHHAVDDEAPVAEAGGLLLLEGIRGRRHFIHERSFRNHAAGKFAGQGVLAHDSLSRIS